MQRTSLSDRIPPAELKRWMDAGGISPNQLAVALGAKFQTVQGWLRGYWPTPRWLEDRINEEAARPGGKLPFYGQCWPEEARTPAAAPEALFKSTPPLAAPVVDDEEAKALAEAEEWLAAQAKARSAAPACARCGAPLKTDGSCSWEHCGDIEDD